MRIEAFACQLVELAPSPLVPGVLYVSQKYKTAVHLCACGCGEKVVTPLSAAEWQVRLQGDRVTLHPSIGNWSMACKSHYWIRNGRVVWSGQLSQRQMNQVFERDRLAVENQQRTNRTNHKHPLGMLHKIWRYFMGD